jgi:hypothetical protein
MYTDLRRILASLDYRFLHVTRGAPPDFGDFKAGADVRTPLDIVRHLCALVDVLQQQFGVVEPSTGSEETFGVECQRFRGSLARLDNCLADGREFRPTRPGFDFANLLQGPVSDALTHIGQLAMLRRLAGSPVERVHYSQAEMPFPASTESTP